MIDPETIEMRTSDNLKKLINTKEYHSFDIIMLNNTSMSFPSYSIRHERCLWKQIKYGKIS
jgi:hypothetical protein